MSIFSSIWYPKKRGGTMSLTTAYSWNKIRVYCENEKWDNIIDINLSDEEIKIFKQICEDYLKEVK